MQVGLQAENLADRFGCTSNLCQLVHAGQIDDDNDDHDDDELKGIVVGAVLRFEITAPNDNRSNKDKQQVEKKIVLSTF